MAATLLLIRIIRFDQKNLGSIQNLEHEHRPHWYQLWLGLADG